MAMVCPQCHGAFEQRLQCPTCAVRLHYQSTRPPVSGRSNEANQNWPQTPWGRIFIGLLLAEGLYFGLRQFCTAGLLASGEGAAGDVWATLYGLVLLQALQGLGLVAGGALAGASRRQGVVFGAVVGVWSGVLSLGLLAWQGQPLTPVTLFGQPILHTFFGAVGGFLGSLIWKPPPALDLPAAPRPLIGLGPSRRRSFLAGPVAWWRVLAGAALAAGGAIWANVILELVMEASEGKLTISTHLQAQLVTWEITALVMLAGSALAGATTSNGAKQGLFVGLAASAVMVGIHLGASHVALPQLTLSVVCALALGVVGGWFGSQLLPPVVSARPKGLGPASL